MRRVLLGVGLALVATIGFAVWVGYTRLNQPFKGYKAPEQFVEIPPGTAAPEIGRTLVAAGVVSDELTFRLALRVGGKAGSLKAGEFRFDRAMTASEVIDKISRGDVYLRTVTFPEGLTIEESAAIFEKQQLGPASEFMKAARAVELVKAFDAVAEDLEGYLFPDTYKVPRKISAAALVREMIAGFERNFGPGLRQEAAARGLSVRQAVTLASLIEKETARPEERQVVSAVYSNRLRLGMALQADPTVIYGLRRAGRYAGNLTRENLAFDSPYNTYRYPGLPPGPIASPGRLSLEASVRPAAVDYLYFVSRNDGSHVFAATLDEHNRNVYEHQVLYFREKRKAEGK
jgi:UPF0755 protein